MTFYTEQYREKHLQQIKSKAGTRYQPELNVDLPISSIFDGISRTGIFYSNIRKMYGELSRSFKSLTSKYDDIELQNCYFEFKADVDELLKILNVIELYSTEIMPWDKVHAASKIAIDKSINFRRLLDEVVERIKSKEAAINKGQQYIPPEKFNNEFPYISKIHSKITDIDNFAVSAQAKLSNAPCLMVAGSAGTGKTHLLCDLAERRISNQQPILVLFGDELYNGENIWLQIISRLKLEREFKSEDEFLKALNALGEISKCRSLLVIDAINENISRTPNFWKKHMPAITKEIIKYPYIAFIISVRKGFENEVLTKSQQDMFLHQEHYGFSFKVWEAVHKFFNWFKLPLPEIPLLMSEFQYPLFLLINDR